MPVDFVAIAGEVARQLLGEPNETLTSRTELRFGSKGSLTIDLTKGTFYDNETSTGGGLLQLIIRELPETKDARGAMEWLRREGYASEATDDGTEVVRRFFEFRDERGALLYREVRRERSDTGKRIQNWFERPAKDGEAGDNVRDGFVKGKGALAGVRRVIYRLPQILALAAGSLVIIAEGPKKAETLIELGFEATNSPGGAGPGKWRPDYNLAFVGKDVVIIPDNDPQARNKKTGELLFDRNGVPRFPGQDYAAEIARKLRGTARSIKILNLPGLPLKGDVVDWVAGGGTREQLQELIDGAPPVVPPSGNEGGEDEDDRPLEYSDSTLARLFAETYKDQLKFVPAWGKWYRWEGSYWKADDVLAAFNAAHVLCRNEARRCAAEGGLPSTARSIASSKTVNAVVALGRSDPRIVASADIWDADPWLLCTPTGVVDLRTGVLGPSRPELYMTMRTGVSPAPIEEGVDPCPTWTAHLQKIFAGDNDLIAYVQRACGYMLTGETSEQCMFFLHGEGQNGKSKFVDAISGILGSYQTTAPIETFIASVGDRHPTELAGLRGARLVTAVETEEGRAWAESKIKMMTGGDKVAARYMRQDFFNFIPQFKLVIFGNHKPSLKTVDKAIRRRMNLWPFEVIIPEGERDLYIGDKLKEEWSGIFSWMIQGCLAWQAQRLAPSAKVIDATEQYLEAEDSFKMWMDDCCEKGSESFMTPTTWMFNSWRGWAERAGEHVGTQKRFNQKMETAGYKSQKLNDASRKIRDVRGYRGIRLIAKDDRRPGGGEDSGEVMPF